MTCAATAEKCFSTPNQMSWFNQLRKKHSLIKCRGWLQRFNPLLSKTCCNVLQYLEFSTLSMQMQVTEAKSSNKAREQHATLRSLLRSSAHYCSNYQWESANGRPSCSQRMNWCPSLFACFFHPPFDHFNPNGLRHSHLMLSSPPQLYFYVSATTLGS